MPNFIRRPLGFVPPDHAYRPRIAQAKPPDAVTGTLMARRMPVILRDPPGRPVKDVDLA
jgi:hypothetical protein